jgi:hypothetical protein
MIYSAGAPGGQGAGRRSFGLKMANAGTQRQRIRLKCTKRQENEQSMAQVRASLSALSFAVFLGGCPLFLAACNETSGGPGPVASAPSGPVALRLPPGANCSALIKNYQDVLQHDLETGNVAQSVYDAIQHELVSASRACEAGQEGEARSIVAASKERHGYHG